MKQLSNMIFKLIVSKIDRKKPEPYERYQCSAKSSNAGEFNCCVKETGHKGLHMSADGITWF